MMIRTYTLSAVASLALALGCASESDDGTPSDTSSGNVFPSSDTSSLADTMAPDTTTPATPDTTPATPDTTVATPDTTPATPDTTPATPDTTPATPDTNVATPDTGEVADIAVPPEDPGFDTELCGTYAEQIQPVIQKACVSCHNTQTPLGSLDLSAGTQYNTLTTKSSKSGVPFVVPGDLAGSYLASKVTDTPMDGAKMPPPPATLTDDEIAHLWAWIGNGAPNGAYGPCDPPLPQGSKVSFEVVSQETTPGNLIVALFKAFPPAGPPDYIVQVPNVAFPALTALDDVAPGIYTAYVILDVAPFDAGNQGPEDLTNTAQVVVPAPKTVVLMLGAFGEEACGNCGLDTTCGADPVDETLCSSAPGACGDVTSAGVCFSDTVVLRCVDDEDPNGRLVSKDCGLAGEVCGSTTNPAGFGCVKAPEPEPEPTPENVPFSKIHPVFQDKCSGLFCHGLGFAQDDVNAAYDVILTKDLVLKILGAVESGAMPKGFLGATICTGDPSVDDNPKCFTQPDMDLLIAWVMSETGQDPTVKPEPPAVPVPFTDVHPILASKCSGGICHGGGLANPDIAFAYDTILEKNLCENIWYQVKFGKMPAGKGCTGDPAEDSTLDGCLNEEEYTLLKDWVNGDIHCGE